MTTSWKECVGEASWIDEALRRTLRYAEPLPVQQAVIPTVARAVLSGISMDVSLTAPTGSGKTLCYLLPSLRVITEAKKGVDDTRLRVLILVPTKALGQQVYREVQQLTRHTSISSATLCAEAGTVKEEAQQLVRGVRCVPVGASSSVTANSADFVRYYARTDILVATPQRLLRHLDDTEGLTLASLRLLVIDEADQVLAGNFANFVAKVVERFEDECAVQRAAEVALGARAGSGCCGLWQSRNSCTLHKVLCSATLSSRISRISEVRLRNCRYFALDSAGAEVQGAGEAAVAQTAGSGQQLIKTSFALPPTLQEHIVFVEDSYRHAVLLRLVRTLVTKMEGEQRTRKVEQRAREAMEIGEATGAPEEVAVDGAVGALTVRAEDNLAQYPVTSDGAGSGILVFCSSAEEARVMGHFLSAAGVKGVVEFTTLATEAERRRALLTPCSCVVASDALMRGIDIPNVGHVIMYHAPESISQYVHRAGRTARAMRAGHVHLLLSKVGASGGLEDGEVARYKGLGALVSRTLAPRYERHFFLFAKAPLSSKQQQKATTEGGGEEEGSSTPAATATTSDAPESPPGPGTAEWWCAEADRFLKQSQHQLQIHWSSALQALSSASTAAGSLSPTCGSAVTTVMPTDSAQRDARDGGRPGDDVKVTRAGQKRQR